MYYFIKHLVKKNLSYTVLICFLIFSAESILAQPNISYTPSTNALSTGIPFSITPYNSGSSVPATIYGQVTTLLSTSGGLNNPQAICNDASGNIYVADYANNVIRKVTSAGVVSTLAGSGAAAELDGTGTAAKFNGPDGIAYDGSGNLFVADAGGNVIRKIVIATGVVTTYAGTGAAGSSNSTRLASTFNNPAGLDLDASGNIYVCDQGNNLIRAITPTAVTTLAGSGAAAATNGTGTTAAFNQPNDLALDGTGNIFVADYLNSLVRKIVISTKVVTTFAGSTAGYTDGMGTAAKFNRLASLTVDALGNIYVADLSNNRIRVISPAMVVTTLAGSGTASEVDGTGTSATFSSPAGICTDNAGNLYVMDFQSGTTGSVRKVLLTGYAISPTLSGSLTFDATTGTISGTPTAFASTAYTVTAYNTTGSNATPITLSCTAPSITNWLGATNSSWSTASNWSAGVPTTAQTAEIGVASYTGAAAQPTLSASATVKAIVLGTLNTPTLTIASGQTLTASNGLTVNPSSTAIVKGPGILTIGGSSTITSTGNLTASLNAVITLASGASMTNSGSFTLSSDANGSASIAAIPSGSYINGTVKVQRFVTGGTTYLLGRWVYRNYRLMSSPVNSGADGSGNYPYSLNYLGASTIITDCTSTYATKGGNPSLYLYNEKYTPVNTTFTNGNFVGVTNISNTVPSGQITTTDATNGSAKIYPGDGFMLYFRGNNTTSITGSPSKTSYPYVAPESVTFTATGNLNQGTYSVTSWTGVAGLLYSTANVGNLLVRGYNLVGNPYPSSIDWSTFSNSSSAAAIYGSNVNPTVYILNPVTNNFDTYSATTGVHTGNASNVIPSGQGFFVQANAASPTLTFKEAAKTSAQVTGSSLLLGKPTLQTAYKSYMGLQLTTDSLNNDDIIIGFNSSSKIAFNPLEDSEFFRGTSSAQSISIAGSDSIKTSVKWLPLPKNNLNLIIKLDVSAKVNGTYQINRTDLKELPAMYEVWLKDNYIKDSLDIKHNTAYKFNIDLADSASFGSNRFQVVIRKDPALHLHLLNFTASKATGGSQLVWTTENEQNYTNFTIERSTNNGQNFDVIGSVSSAGRGTYSYLDKTPTAGADLYRIKLSDIDGNITYTKVITLIYDNVTAQTSNSISVYPNPARALINMAINVDHNQAVNLPVDNDTLIQKPAVSLSTKVYKIQISSTAGYIIKTATVNQRLWQTDVSNLLPGVYHVVVIENNTKNVIGKSSFIKL